MFFWKIVFFGAILAFVSDYVSDLPVIDHQYRMSVEDGIDYFRPGPMQTEPVNLVRRGTEQP